MSGHERERLSAYLDGELTAREIAAVEAHLGACAECTAFLADLAAVDEAAARLPAEAPEGYFESFPARVRARLGPREAGRPVRRVPIWTWAAAAALLLAVVTPLTLRQTRPRSIPARSETSENAPAVVWPDSSLDRGAPSVRPTPSPAVPRPAPRAPVRPTEPQATPMAPQDAPAVAGEAEAYREGKVQTAPGAAKAEAEVFAPEPAAPAPREGAAGSPPAAGTEIDLLRVAPEDAARRRQNPGAAPAPGATAELASPALTAAGAGRDAATAGLEAPADAFDRLEAARPRTTAGWRRLREQWSALAAAETDPVRADEARVRSVIAAREAWLAGGGDGDLAVFRVVAESYLRREDARQKPRVSSLLAEAKAPRAP